MLKRERDRAALVDAATGGHPRFFLGTDSAPHPRGEKESSCGCAGIFSAPVALELYAEVFHSAGRLDRLEGFASHHGPDFYGLPRNRDRVRIEAVADPETAMTDRAAPGAGPIEVFWAGVPLRFRARRVEQIA